MTRNLASLRRAPLHRAAAALALACAFSPALALAQPVHYGASRWDMRDGLPHNLVHSIAQDRQGFLWVATWEGVVRLAKAYYEWTDAQTPAVEGDGKAFFGRDAFANYMLIGSLQLGVELFRVENGALRLQMDETVMRRLWDHYYVPFVNGWFGAYGRFRSDDIKTGQLIALVGSTSGALYFPNEVTRDDGTTYPIVCEVYPLPNFEGTQPCAVQQGAGMVGERSS